MQVRRLLLSYSEDFGLPFDQVWNYGSELRPLLWYHGNMCERKTPLGNKTVCMLSLEISSGEI